MIYLHSSEQTRTIAKLTEDTVYIIMKPITAERSTIRTIP